MATSNIIKATFNGISLETYTAPAYQYDVGMSIQFVGLELPANYEVHFSNQVDGGEAKTVIGTSDTVAIPDSVFTSGAYVYAFVYLVDNETSGFTVYRATIPIKKRPAITDQTPTPEEAPVIAQAIALLNEATELMAQYTNWNISIDEAGVASFEKGVN